MEGTPSEKTSAKPVTLYPKARFKIPDPDLGPEEIIEVENRLRCFYMAEVVNVKTGEVLCSASGESPHFAKLKLREKMQHIHGVNPFKE